jgi:hypothetical protein
MLVMSASLAARILAEELLTNTALFLSTPYHSIACGTLRGGSVAKIPLIKRAEDFREIFDERFKWRRRFGTMLAPKLR